MDWKIFLSVFLKDTEIFYEFITYLEVGIFKDVILSNLFILIRKYFDKYKKIPDFDMVSVLLDKLPESEKKNLEEYTNLIAELQKISVRFDADVYKEQVYRCIQQYDMEKFILHSANNIDKITFEDMLSSIRTVMSKHVPKNFGLDVSQVDRNLKLIKYSPDEKISTGLDSLNKVLYGGYGVNEIVVVMAPPGRGKSFFLLNAMYSAMLSQHDVLYVTAELSEKAVIKRLYGRMSYSSRKEMIDEKVLAKSVGRYFSLAKASGRIIYFPSRSLSIEGLETILEQYHMYFNFVPKIIIVDYLDLLAPKSTDYRLEPRHRLRGITDDLRSISLRRNVPIITATQANRASLSQIKITEANVSESFGKVEVADVVIAICQTDEEKKTKRARLVLLKNRDYVAGACIEVYVDFDRMLLLDLGVASKMGLLEDVDTAS